MVRIGLLSMHQHSTGKLAVAGSVVVVSEGVGLGVSARSFEFGQLKEIPRLRLNHSYLGSMLFRV